MTIKFTNNATSTLAAGISDSATSFSVATGQGGLFPTLSGADVFYATISNTAGAVEIVKVTARSTDALTVVRGQDGTSALAWNLGDKFELRATAAGLTAMAQTANNLSDLASASTARTNLGLGTIATQDASNVTISGGSISGITDLAVADGGTGVSTLTSGGYLKGAGTSAITSQEGIPAGDITSGTIGTARLGSGTASSSTYLRGDSTWATVTSLPGAQGQVFTASGTFTIPAGITAVKVTVVGGGGGGGGASVGAAGGGGGGGAAIKYLTGLTPGNTLTVTRGAGGTAGSGAPGNGGTGGTSSVASGTQTISTISATGGAGSTSGVGSTPLSGAAGGVGSGGNMNMNGTGGGASFFNASDSFAKSGAGGSSIFGGGGRGGVGALAGAAGGAYGGGAGGSSAITGAGNIAGAAGAAGVVVFEW